jgi:diguanylate cyclase (GGDEF)-like protein
VARYGGDEFVVVAEELPWPDAAVDVAARILAAASTAIPRSSGAISVSASVGGTVATDALTPEEVLRNADTAMYEAKQRGGHTISWVDLDTRRM